MKKLTLLILAFILALPVFAEEVPQTWIPFDQDGTLFIKLDESGDRYVLVNKDGAEANEDKDFFAYREDFFPEILYVKYNGLYGFIDSSGTWIAKPQFDDTNGFQDNGLADVKNDGLWGLINLKGEYVFEPQFEDYLYWDQYFIHFYNHVACVMKGGLYGFIREDGTFLFEPQFDGAGDFDGSSFAPIRKGALSGYVTLDGEYLAEPQFDHAWEFDDDDCYALIEKDGLLGYIGCDGKIAIEPQAFEKAENFCGDYARVKQNGLFGYIDREGNYALEPSFVDASADNCDGIAAVSPDGEKWGYIKMDGEYLFEPVFDRTSDFVCGVAAVKLGSIGLVSKDGSMLLEPEYTSMYLYRDGEAYSFFDYYEGWVSFEDEEKELGLEPVNYDFVVIAVKGYEVYNYVFIDGEFTQIPIVRSYIHFF